MWAVGTINEDYLGYLPLSKLNYAVHLLTTSPVLWQSNFGCCLEGIGGLTPTFIKFDADISGG